MIKLRTFDKKIFSLLPPKIDTITSTELKNYFINSWVLYETLFKILISEDIFFKQPDLLRNL